MTNKSGEIIETDVDIGTCKWPLSKWYQCMGSWSWCDGFRKYWTNTRDGGHEFFRQIDVR